MGNLFYRLVILEAFWLIVRGIKIRVNYIDWTPWVTILLDRKHFSLFILIYIHYYGAHVAAKFALI